MSVHHERHAWASNKKRKTAPNQASERQKNHRKKKVFASSSRLQCFDFASSRTSKLNISADILTFSPLF
jgi:hypothetical protein